MKPVTSTSPQNPSVYQRADTGWLASCRFGLSVHWTAQTVGRDGTIQPFSQAVANFNLAEFLTAFDAAGADYLLFTLTHARQYFPGPHPILDSILKGRTSERDLVGEVCQALRQRGKPLILYYNHSCNSGDDPAWENAVGYHGKNKPVFAENICRLVAWIGDRYGSGFWGWWFDSCYSLDERGPHNSMTGNFGAYRFPWEALTRSAKAGFPERLVAFNAGIRESFLYTDHQDYWAGEMSEPGAPLPARYLKNGLQGHAWFCLDNPNWLQSQPVFNKPLYRPEDLAAYIGACNQHRIPVTLYVGILQDGTINPAAVACMQEIVKRAPT